MSKKFFAENFTKIIGCAISILVLFGLLFSAYRHFECKFAPIVLADEVRGAKDEVRKVKEETKEEVKKVDKKIDKTLQIMEYKFKAIQLEDLDNRIYRTKRDSGKNISKSEKDKLHDLEQDRKKVLQEMEELKK